MDPHRWARIESLYHAALAKEPAERPHYLAAACAQEPELQHEVESLLWSEQSGERFIEEPALIFLEARR